MKFVQSYPEPQAAPGGAEGPHAWWQRAAPAEGPEAPRFRGHLTTGGSACTTQQLINAQSMLVSLIR